MTAPDVIVIGAGVAGLRAAVALAARGARVSVLEAKAVGDAIEDIGDAIGR